MSLTEAELRDLLAKGESSTAEFKRQLNLGTAIGKAEFVKDIVALANSAAPVSHLIVGVEDNGVVIGAPALECERIQQIIDTYIAPTLSVSCLEIQISSPLNRAVQIIEITAPRRPYFVSRDIERLLANEVLVRHGSVVARASPIEIAEMRDETLGGRETKRYLRRAELLLRDGRFQEAMAASTEAVAVFPSALGYLYRGRSYLGLEAKAEDEFLEATNHRGLSWLWSINDPIEKRAKQLEVDAIQRKQSEYTQGALKDYAEAISLADTLDLQKQIRFERLKRWLLEDDFKWLEAHTDGWEAGKILYFRTVKLDENDYMFRETLEKAETYLNKALELGFDSAGVHFLLAQVHLSKQNAGSASEEVELAISKWEDGDRESVHDVDQFRDLEALIRSRIGDFDRAFYHRYERVLDQRGSHYNDEVWGIEEEILCRYAIAFYARSIVQGQDQEGLQIMQILADHIPELKTKHPRCAEAVEALLKRRNSSK